MTVPDWLWALALSPFVGSFLGVVATRFDRPREILLGRSACAACGARLGPWELVPIAAWIALRGRCRCGAAPIGAFHIAIELAAVSVAAWAALETDGWALWASCGLGWTLLALAAIDLRRFVLPDFLTLPLAAAGLAAGAALDPASLADRGIGAAAGFLFVVALREAYRALRRREGIGLGDAKLLAAAGAWVSWTGLPTVLFLAAFAALAVALTKIARGIPLNSADRLPFGAYLCGATWIAWLYGPLRLAP
jgi:leader peptidase (prepilin peptidase)/N-methyltransferase